MSMFITHILQLKGGAMINNEKKKELLEKYLPLIHESQDDTEFNAELHALLLSDTQNGKLYKYRSFDKKGWALKSLSTQTLHCSSPEVFNDPFDCKLGIDFNSITTDMYEMEFDIVGDLLSEAIAVINSEKTLNEFDENDKEIIDKLINGAFGSFYRKHCNEELTEEAISNLLFDNFEIVKELMDIVANNSKYGEQLRVSNQMMPKIIENMDDNGRATLLDDNATFIDFAKSNGIDEDVDEMQFASLLYQKNFPEKADTAKGSEAKLAEIGGKVTTMLSSLFFIGCLCTDYKNRLMWSHYAGSHTGFCIEYDYSNFGNNDNKNLPFPVVYSSKRIKVPWKAALNNTKENMYNATQQLLFALLTKDIAWQYENEWRVLVNAQNSQDVKCAPITCVYLGALCSEKNKRKILKISKKLGIPVKQMTVDRGEYELHAKELS